jgi:hypothetical protein
MTIEHSQGQRVHVHADAIVMKETPIKFLVGNNVNMRTKCVTNFAEKTIEFNTMDILSKAGIYVVMCKQCNSKCWQCCTYKARLVNSSQSDNGHNSSSRK